MKLGDLVKFQLHTAHVGIIIEVGIYTGRKDVKVLWSGDPRPYTERSAVLEVVHPS
jgi:hypothetical protein